ncbi:MAG TPA: ATP-binding protein [Gemmatimonadaceae bacterium]|nr:ATP-binding protein [Gemmatimonadaceae bacterium]
MISGADDLAELLSALAEAPDFHSASGFLLEQLTAGAGARRGFLLVLDRDGRELRGVRGVGLDEEVVRAFRLPLDDEGHPLVVCALGLEPIACDGAAVVRFDPPLDHWLALPLPQPLYRGSPTLRPDRARTFDERFSGCRVVRTGEAAARRRFSRAPFAVAVLEAGVADGVLEPLATLALLAGPVLARMFAVDALQRAASELQAQRSLLTTIIDALPDPIVITDASNNVIVQNTRAEHLLTFGETDSEGRRRALEINNLLFSSFLSRSVMGGAPQATGRELNLVDPDEGTDLLFEVLVHPLTAAVAREGAQLSVLRDVTDLKRAAGELERQFQRLRLTESEATRERDRLNMILNNVGDPILVTDDQAKIILMNPQAERLFDPPHGGSADRLASQRVRGNDTKFTTLISDFAISPALYRRAQLALAQPESGTELPVEVVSGKIMNERGEPMAIVSVLHDLTKQVENQRLYEALKKFSAELEDRVRLATADLEAQNLKLQWQSSELEKAYRLKSEFLANMSHELRTPINALIGYTALMLDRIYGDLTPKQEEGLRRIQVSSQHLLALINDILDLAKIEAGRMPVHLESISLVPTIDEVVTQIEPMVRAKALTFHREVDDGLPLVSTDRTKVKQILLNLLSNAVKFTHRGEVALRVRTARSGVEIQVSDTGIGIKPDHLDLIFEEFRQVDQSRTREYGGTGLGLSITRKLVALLGGTITVTSEVGAGSTFAIWLPLRSEELSSDEQVTRAAIGSLPP